MLWVHDELQSGNYRLRGVIKLIYLDNSATTKVKPEILEVMLPYFTDKWYNPSSVYSSSVEIKHDIENARKIVGDFIGANADEIFFHRTFLLAVWQMSCQQYIWKQEEIQEICILIQKNYEKVKII